MIKLTFKLFPKDGRIKPYEHPYGYVFRGVIMKWLHEIKPELVHELHSFEKVRPYAINCIIHKKIPKIHFVIVSMDDFLSETLLQDLITSERVKLKIGQKDYFISSIKFARIDVKRDLVDKSKPIKGFNIQFVKPIYFNTSMGDYSVRFPLPNLLFGNLANIWNDNVSDITLVDRNSFINWVNAHIYISGYKLRTVKSEIGKSKPMIGAIGNASYRVTKINKKYYIHFLDENKSSYDYKMVNEDYRGNCRWLETLCMMGEYTNVGANRTAGMGVIKYYSREYITDRDLVSSN